VKEEQFKLLSETVKEIQKVENHPLELHEEYVKDIYFTMLASVIQADGVVKQDELDLYGKLIRGAGLDCDATKYIKCFDERFNREFIGEFVDSIRLNNLIFVFVVDALVLAKVDGELHDKESELIANICDLFGINDTDLEILVHIAASILEGKTDNLIKVKRAPESKISLVDFSHYFAMLGGNLELPLSVNDLSRESINGGRYIINSDIKHDLKKMRITNAKIRFTDEGFLTFSNMDEVTIENTVFINPRVTVEFTKMLNITGSKFSKGNNRALMIESCDRGAIESCEFSDFTFDFHPGTTIHGALFCIKTSYIDIKDTIFKETKTKPQSDDKKRNNDEKQLKPADIISVVYIQEDVQVKENNVISNCKFINHNVMNAYGFYLDSIIGQNLYNIENCLFSNFATRCYGFYRRSSVYIENLNAIETLTSCKFKNATVFVNSCNIIDAFKECSFIDSNLDYRICIKTITGKNSFINGKYYYYGGYGDWSPGSST